jgi:hypothetical protein
MGLAAVVRPDYPPVLPPAADSDGFADRAAPRPERPAPAVQPADPARSNAVTVMERKARQHMNVAEPGFDKIERRPTPVLDDEDRPAEPHSHVMVAPTLAQRQRRDAGADFQASRQDYFETPVSIDSNDEAVAPVHHNAPSPAAIPLPTGPAPQWRPAAPPQPPTIQVTIGKVEIRAVTPPPAAAPQRSAERRAAARLSLDEYLRQRNEGRR